MESTQQAARVLEALAAADPEKAREELRGLIGRLRSSESDGIDLPDFGASFRSLLRRRGYFVSTPIQVADSLAQIRDIGPGFDLYDLAATLAQYDAALMARSGRPRERILPELGTFPPCPDESDENPNRRNHHVLR